MSEVEPRYTIEEAAQRTGVSAHTLRYYFEVLTNKIEYYRALLGEHSDELIRS